MERTYRKVSAQIKQTLLLETDQATDMKTLVNRWFGTRLNILETGVRSDEDDLNSRPPKGPEKTGVDFRRTKSKPLKQRWRKWKRTCLLDTSFGGELRLNLWQLLAFPWERRWDLTHGNGAFSFFRKFGIVNLNITPGKQSILNTQFQSPYFTLFFVDLPKTLDESLGFITPICNPKKLHPPVLVDHNWGPSDQPFRTSKKELIECGISPGQVSQEPEMQERVEWACAMAPWWWATQRRCVVFFFVVFVVVLFLFFRGCIKKTKRWWENGKSWSFFC